MVQPEKAATPVPAVAFTGLPLPLLQSSVAPVVPVPVLITSATWVVSVVTGLPPRSSTATFGWVPKAVPPVELLGCWVKASFAGGPTLMVNVALSAGVRVPSAACSWYGTADALSTLQPAKAATPDVAATGLVVQLSAAPAAPVAGVIDSSTLLVSVVTTLPPASSTTTFGWVPNAVPPVESLGCWVNTSLVAAPAVMSNVVLSAVASEPSTACSL